MQGSYSVPGELYVPLADMSRGADPYQYNWFLSDRGKEKLGPTGRKKS